MPLKSYNKKHAVKSFGLINSGALCYFNALIQALCGCTSLNEYVKQCDDNGVIDEYRRLIESKLPVRDTTNLQKELHLRLKRSKDKSRQLFSSGGQQCADEALKLLLEAMGDNILIRLTVKYTSIIPCSCGHSSSEIEDTNSFIKLIGNEISISTQEEFQKYILRHAEIIEGYTCEQCGVKENRYRIHKLARLNEIIVIILLKYSGKRVIYYPARLSFPKLGGGNLEYRLVSQIDHYGTMTGGHYIAKSIRNNDGLSVIVANDDHVNEAPPGCFLPNPHSYMLFYHLIN